MPAVQPASYKPRVLLHILQRILILLLFCAVHGHTLFAVEFFIYWLCIAAITYWWLCCLSPGPSLAQTADGPVFLQYNGGSSHACRSGWCPLNQAHGTRTFHSRGFCSLFFAGWLTQRQLNHWSELLDVATIPLPNKGRLWFMQWKQSGWKCLRIQQPACFQLIPGPRKLSSY